MISIFLNPEVFNWHSVIKSTAPFERHHQLRLYQIWNHAKSIAEASNTKDERGDSITNLNKIIDLRVKELNKIYSLSKYLKRLKPLDRLIHLGIIRYHLLEKIDRVRNLYLHQDNDPPKKDELLNLIEFVWYFLKATDGIVIKRRTGVQVNSTGRIDDSENYFEMHIKFEDNPSLLISGRGNKEYFSLSNDFYSRIELICLERNFRVSEEKNLIRFFEAQTKEGAHLLNFLKKFFEAI